MAQSKVNAFRQTVWRYYRTHGRYDLPWRKTHDLYKILVSEMMLQQTQVERVVPFYKNFIKKFPTVQKLADAPLSGVLKSWQGLGYNRRAKMLHQAAKEFPRFDLTSESSRSNLIPRLEALPGVGPYTARAVAAFAYNDDVIFVETNIRTVVIHHFFNRNKNRNTIIYDSVSDSQIEAILRKVLPKGKSREWYSALMDYGAYLKQSGVSHNAKSKTYAKQSKFAGSLREARGTILRTLASKKSQQGGALLNVLGAERRAQMKKALDALVAEKLVNKKGKTFALAD